MVAYLKNKNNNSSCKAKRLLGVHANMEHSNQPVNQAGRRIRVRLSFLALDVLRHFFSFCSITAFQLLPYSYYNICSNKRPNRFSENNVIVTCMNASLGDVALCHEVSVKNRICS